MKEKSITCHAQSVTVSAKSVTSRAGRSPKWHGRVPADVSLDLSVSSDAVRIYAILALKTFQGNISTIGLRQIGKLIGRSRTTIQRRVQELVNAGHVAVSDADNGQRSHYELLSPVFGQKQRTGAPAETVSYPRRRLATTGLAS